LIIINTKHKNIRAKTAENKEYRGRIIMTYRNNGSYLRFHKAKKLGSKPSQANAIMNWLIRENPDSGHLQDHPAVTSTQNAFDTLE
jgi:hypothetical protein